MTNFVIIAYFVKERLTSNKLDMRIYLNKRSIIFELEIIFIFVFEYAKLNNKS